MLEVGGDEITNILIMQNIELHLKMMQGVSYESMPPIYIKFERSRILAFIFFYFKDLLCVIIITCI